MSIKDGKWSAIKRKYIKEHKKSKDKNAYLRKLFKEFFPLISFNGNKIDSNTLYRMYNKLISLKLENNYLDSFTIAIVRNSCYEVFLNNEEEMEQIDRFKKENPYVFFNNTQTDKEYYGSRNGLVYETDSTNIGDKNLQASKIDTSLFNIIDGYLYTLNKIKNRIIKDCEKTFDPITGEEMFWDKVNKIESVKSNRKLNGKDWVKHYMFNPDEEGHLYFIKFKYNSKIFYKVGITKHCIKIRYGGLNNIEILEEFEVKRPMLECALIERYIHNENYHYREHIDEDLFNGQNECYFNDMLPMYKDNEDTILEKSINNLDKESYPISVNAMKLILKEIYDRKNS